MPVTRSRQMKTSGSSKISVSRRGIETNYEVESSIDSTLEATRECKDVEDHLKEALSGLGNLRESVEVLQARNRELQEQLDRLHEVEEVFLQPKPAKRGGMSVQAMKQRISKLSSEISKLERAREKDRKKIKNLKMKEIERDAAELQDDTVQGIGDTFDRMRKLLRRFHTVISSPSVEEEEECIVCLEKLTLETAISLPCQHIYCKKCLMGNARAQATPKCPSCRETYEADLDGAERVPFTATQQWDALLEIAQDWARIDNHGGEEEPEDSEEEETPFINDDHQDISSSAPSEPDVSENEDMLDLPAPSQVSHSRPTTPTNLDAGEAGLTRTPYSQSPTSEKRKRLEELAAARRLKRRLAVQLQVQVAGDDKQIQTCGLGFEPLTQTTPQACPQHPRSDHPKVMTTTSDATAASGDAPSTTDGNENQHALHTKLARKEKKKRRRSDPEEDEVEAIVATETLPEGGSGASDPVKGSRKKRKKKVEVAVSPELADASETIQQEGQHRVMDESSTDKGKKKKKKSKGKDKERADVPIDPELGGDAANQPIFQVGYQPPSFQPYPHPMIPPMQYPGLHFPSPGGSHSHLAFPSPYTLPAPGTVPEALLQVLGLNSLGNNGEEITRALQNLDLSKIADVLRQLQGTSAGASAAFSDSGHHQPTQEQTDLQRQELMDENSSVSTPSNATDSVAGSNNAHSSSIGITLPEMNASQVPVPSALILGQPLRNPPKVVTSGQVSMPSITTNENPEHAYLLAHKWHGTEKLRRLAKKTGLVYKKGKFSTAEEAIIKEGIERYRVTRGLTDEQFNQLIFAKTPKGKQPSPFWCEIAEQVPLRPLIAVYHYIRRAYHPLKHRGKWTPEEDEACRQAVAELGPQWEQVSTRVGRMASDCRDRWRNHLNNSDARKQGPWTKEEEEKLTRIVKELTIEQANEIANMDELNRKYANLDKDNEIFWAIVEERMGNERGRQQCRIKWTDALSKTVKNGGKKPRWSQQDAFILVHKIASLNVRDDSEIDWKLLSDDDWNLWSAHSLQRRWLTLKRSIRGHEEMTHQEIMDILRLKKTNMPPPPVQQKKQRVTSEATVPLDLQNGDVEGGPIAGPSNLGAISSRQILDMTSSLQQPAGGSQIQNTVELSNEQGDGDASSSSPESSDEDSDESSDSD